MAGGCSRMKKEEKERYMTNLHAASSNRKLTIFEEIASENYKVRFIIKCEDDQCTNQTKIIKFFKGNDSPDVKNHAECKIDWKQDKTAIFFPHQLEQYWEENEFLEKVAVSTVTEFIDWNGYEGIFFINFRSSTQMGYFTARCDHYRSKEH